MLENQKFKTTDSPLTPEPDRQTTFSINRAGTERFLARLVDAGMTLQPDGAYTDDTLPTWSVMRARRHYTDLNAGLIARGLIMRLSGEVMSVDVFASANGALTSAVERAIGRQALAKHPYLAVVADRGLLKAPAYTKAFQAEIEPDCEHFGGLRSDSEVINYLLSRPELSGR